MLFPETTNKYPDKATRNKIYRSALEHFTTAKYVTGLCNSLHSCSYNASLDYQFEGYAISKDEYVYPEISKHIPLSKKDKPNGYWFSLKNKAIRIAIFEQAIEETND